MSVLAHVGIGLSLRNSGGAKMCDRLARFCRDRAFGDGGNNTGVGNGLGAKGLSSGPSFGAQNNTNGIGGIGPAALGWHSTQESAIASTANRRRRDSIRGGLQSHLTKCLVIGPPSVGRKIVCYDPVEHRWEIELWPVSNIPVPSAN